MIKKWSLVLCVLSFPMLFLLTCTGESPFKPQNATVNLTLENSGGHSDPATITDTAENSVRITMIGYLPTYIDSVKIVIGTSAVTDTGFTFPKSTSWADSQRIEITFHSAGTRTVTVTVFVEGKEKTVTATIVVVGRTVNHKPLLTISGVRNITTAQTCSLSLSTTDIDSGQTYTYAMIKAPQGATLNANLFKWTPLAGHTGTDTATFTVTDNGKPPMSDMQTVFITVSLQITVPVKVQGIKAVSKNNGYFVFSWNKVSNADSYDVFRSADNVNFQKIGSSSDSLFGDSVKTGNFYYYVVAVNSAGPSPASAIVYSGSIKTPPVIMVLSDTAVSQGKTLAFTVRYVASAQDTVTLSATDISGAGLPDSATFDPGTGLFTWTPTYSQLGLYKIVFTAANGNAVARDTVKITVTKTDRPPTVQAQSLNTGMNLPITVTLSATDPDNDTLTKWQITQAPHSGTATLADSTKGKIVYTPGTGFTGVDTFAVKAFDGILWSQASANMIITVSSIKVAPKIQTQPRPDTAVSQGGSVAFVVAINNASPSPMFYWYQGVKGSGTLKDSSTNPLYQKTAVTAADSGNYYVIVVNSSGADTSAYAHLKVNVPPSAPALVSPANNATGVAISQTLTWSAATGAATYRVQVSTASDFSTGILVDDSTLTTASKALSSLTNSTTYYWRVNAKNAGGTSAWSTAFSFTTIVAVPGVPVLATPVNNATGVVVGPTLTWNAVTGAATYRVQVSTASDFATGIVADDSTLTAGSKALSALTNGTTYYWRVNARNAGGTSAWSAAFSFTAIVAAPGAPALSAPANYATGVAVSQSLSWVTVTGAAAYRVQVSTTSDFSAGIVADDSTLTAASKALSGLTNNTVYYWRVNARNAGGTSAWSTAFTFTTVVAVSGVPVNANPANNATGVALNPTLTWSAVTGAVTYRVQVSTASDFSTGIVADDSTVTTASKTLNSLANNTVYYWRVNAKNAGGTSAWSTISSFTTIVAAPGVPVLLAPANNATGVAVSPTVTWNAVTGAVTYRVQVSTASDFSAGIVVDDSTLTTALKAVGTLSNGTKYYWRVNAKNAGGTSAWASSSFTTIVKFSLTITATNGTVTPNPAGSPYDSGTVVQLNAAPTTPGYQFTGWSGGLTGTANPGYITMNSAKNATANFGLIPYQLTVNAGTGGSITAPSSSPVTVNYGVATPIIASPSAGNKFDSWSVTTGTAAIASATSASTTVTLTSGNATLTANFKPLCQWSTANSGLTNKDVRALAVVSGTSLFAGTYGGGVFLSSNDGSTWTAKNGGFSEFSNYGTEEVVTFAVNGGNIFAGTFGDGVYLSTDKGSTWNYTSNGLTSTAIWALGINGNGSYVFAGVSGYVPGVCFSSDNGNSWSNNHTLSYGVDCFAVNGSSIFAGTLGSGIYSSADYGNTWTADTAGLGTSPMIHCLAISGTTLFAGTEAGMYVSTNQGSTWSAHNSGLSSSTIVRSILVNGGNIFAGTDGGVFLSTDNGTTWVAVNSGMTIAPVYALAVCGTNVYAGTSGNGVYSSPLP